MDSYTAAQWNHTQSIVASLAEEAQEMVLRPGHRMLAEALIRSHVKIIPHHTSTLINSSFSMGTLSIVPSLYHDPCLMGLFKANQEYLFQSPLQSEATRIMGSTGIHLCTIVYNACTATEREMRRQSTITPVLQLGTLDWRSNFSLDMFYLHLLRKWLQNPQERSCQQLSFWPRLFVPAKNHYMFCMKLDNQISVNIRIVSPKTYTFSEFTCICSLLLYFVCTCVWVQRLCLAY